MPVINAYDKLVNELMHKGYLISKPLIRAFKKIKRTDFVPREVRSFAVKNVALPIGYGQTISQPLTVSFMLELLALAPGQRVLDVGSGSGWTTALLATMVGGKGQVYAVERIPELVETSKKNIAPYRFSNVMIVQGDGSKGLPEYQPFDRILVSAAAHNVPPLLVKQLKPSGRMVIPSSHDDIRLIEKRSDETIVQRIFPGFVFVPLIENTQ